MSKHTIEPAMLLNGLQAASPEEIAPGLRVKWLYDRRVLVVTADSSTRPAVDAWTEFQ